PRPLLDRRARPLARRPLGALSRPRRGPRLRRRAPPLPLSGSAIAIRRAQRRAARLRCRARRARLPRPIPARRAATAARGPRGAAGEARRTRAGGTGRGGAERVAWT